MTKINPEKTGRKQTQGPAGCREAKTLRHPSVSPALTSPDVLSSFSLPCERLAATVTSPSNTHPPVTRGDDQLCRGPRALPDPRSRPGEAGWWPWCREAPGPPLLQEGHATATTPGT